MNPYELFWNYHEHNQVPYLKEDKRYNSHDIKTSLADRKTLQLVKLMYKEQGETPTYLRQVMDIDILDVCDNMARANLSTPRYSPRSKDTSRTSETTGHQGGTTSDMQEVKGSAIGTEQNDTLSTTPSIIAPVDLPPRIDLTPPLVLRLSQVGGDAITQAAAQTGACKERTVLLCDTLFLGSFHRRRLLSLATMMNAVVGMDWVRAVASKVVGMEQPVGFGMLDGRPKYEDRHVHYHGGVRKFVELYQTMGDNSVITFSLENSEFAIHMPDFRTGMEKLLVRGNSSQHKSETLVGESLSLVMFACSIGLPLRKLYTPYQFMSKWKNSRFFNVNRDNIVRTILRGLLNSEQVVGNETTQLLLRYEQQQPLFAFDSENSNTTRQSVSTYFYKHWYSYPSKPELSTIVLRVNAIKHFCLSTNTEM